MICEWFAVEKLDLFLVMNDYEMQALSQGLADELRTMGCAVAVLDRSIQQSVIDKYRTAVELDKHGIPTPAAFLRSQHAQLVSTSAPMGSR
ncbi:hypothetical protein [Enteractinococcus coprophilus]|uniref:hypothetical protein n=1 Tax=Enteractinococcus coprophilus TaxID=1027633 RepID=UPI0011536AF3|nr:hypothetical protein [Enteractinococcus coprophilus]